LQNFADDNQTSVTGRVNAGEALVSVIVPVYNEEDVLPEFCTRLYQTMAMSGHPWEAVFVDDGSMYRIYEILQQIPSLGGRIRVVEFSRNFGHQAAIGAGLDHAVGQAVIIIDADLQDPPEVIPRMLQRWRKGAEVVYGVRRRRMESPAMRTMYYLYYRLLKFCAETDIPTDAGDFCLMDRRVVKHVRSLGDSYRFLRGLRAWVGFRQEPLEYDRDTRHAGHAKYGLRDLVGLGLNGLVTFSSFPWKIVAAVGALISLGSFAVSVPTVWLKVFEDQAVPAFEAIAALVLFMGGLQMLFFGLLGEYVNRIHKEVQNRPH
jgi:glycosyltransferase involved in cell wall biosynthesis